VKILIFQKPAVQTAWLTHGWDNRHVLQQNLQKTTWTSLTQQQTDDNKQQPMQFKHTTTILKLWICNDKHKKWLSCDNVTYNQLVSVLTGGTWVHRQTNLLGDAFQRKTIDWNKLLTTKESVFCRYTYVLFYIFICWILSIKLNFWLAYALNIFWYKPLNVTVLDYAITCNQYVNLKHTHFVTQYK